MNSFPSRIKSATSKPNIKCFKTKKIESKASTSIITDISRIKLEINRKNILELRQEGDAVKMEIHKTNVHI